MAGGLDYPHVAEAGDLIEEKRRYGYSSPMRRVSEMAHVAGMVQIGMRGVGSARITEIEPARPYGGRIVSAREVHTHGVEAALQYVPEGARVVISLDCDGPDPNVMPGVVARSPGGLKYTQVIDVIAGVGGGPGSQDLTWSSILRPTLTACQP